MASLFHVQGLFLSRWAWVCVYLERISWVLLPRLAEVRNLTLAGSQNGFHSQGEAVWKFGCPASNQKKEHFYTYSSIVFREIHKQRRALNILCKLLKTAWTSLLQLQVKTQLDSEFHIADYVFLRVPTEVLCWSFITFRAAHQLCTRTGHGLWS